MKGNGNLVLVSQSCDFFLSILGLISFRIWQGNLYYTLTKVSKHGVFPDPYFPVFRLNTEIYPYGKTRARKKLGIWTLFTLCLSKEYQ